MCSEVLPQVWILFSPLFVPSISRFCIHFVWALLDFLNLGVGMGQGEERQEPYFVIIQRGEIRIVAETHRSQL